MGEQRIDRNELLRHVTITAVASRYAEVKRVGSEYVTICPWHNDTKPSLTIFEGKEGLERCYCFACGASGNVIDYYMQQTGEDFKTALRNMADGVMTNAAAKPLVAKDKPIKPADWMASKPPAGQMPKFDHYEFGEPVGVWCFRDTDGQPLFYEARYLRTDEDGEIHKEPRCMTWGRLSVNTPYKWAARHWPSPRPLYGLDQIAKYSDDASIVVFEGPRKAEYAQSMLKVPCVSWAAGAKAWKYSDWSAAKGRKIILFPDNDMPGQLAMRELSAHLYSVGAVSVSIVSIPEGKPEKWDICDEENLTASELKAILKQRIEAKTLESAAIEARAVIGRIKTAYKFDINKVPHDDGGMHHEPEPPAAAPAVAAPAADPAPQGLPDGFKPMMSQPIEWPDPDNIVGDVSANRMKREHLPDLVAGLAFLKAPPTGSDPGAIAMSMLATIASAIDDRIKLYPDRHGSWAESARIWVALVGSPSAKKTFCAEYAAKPLKDADDDIDQQNEHEKRKFKALMKKYDSALSEWIEADQFGPSPQHPAQPEIPRYYMSNTTIEAFGDVMQYNPRGTLIFYDELSGWIGGMGQFKNSGGSDRADWLMSYNGGPQRIDRITRGNIKIPNFSACVIGGIQPDTIAKIAKNTAEDGLLQRFYISFVPEADPGTPPTMDQAMEIKHYEGQYKALIRAMLDMKPDRNRVEMSPEARNITLSTFRDIHKLASLNSFGTKASAALAKFEGGIHRMCLVYHAVECFQMGKHPADLEVSAETATRVCSLFKGYILPNVTYFYNSIIGDASTALNDLKRAGNFILSKGLQKVTASDLRNYGGLKNRTIAERREVITHLIEAGWAEPVDHYSAGGVARKYKINPAVHVKFKTYAEKELRRLEDTINAMRSCGMTVRNVTELA